MEHVICINTNSFPALTAEHGHSLLLDAIYGVLELNVDNDKFVFCLDSNGGTLSDLVISEGYHYSDFVRETKSIDMDLHAFLLEVEDKSPVLDSLTIDELDDITEYTFYAKGHPIAEGMNTDIYSIAWFLSATLLSIKTNENWSSHQLEISRITDNGRYIEDEYLYLKNISCYEHGQHLSKPYADTIPDIKDVLKDHYLTENIIDWYDQLSIDNKKRVVEKLTLSCERNFNGGEPLFKTLTNANGLREIRFNAHPGGATRILFKAQGGKQAILFGFIKKSKSEGYDHAIESANELYPV